MKKKTNKKVASALAMLMLSAAMLGTSTYAWFTMNKTVEVTGMEVKTKVGSNLLICSDNVENNYSSATLIQGRKGLLEPVSSISGATGSFYYTVNATARGQKETGATITKYDETTKVANTTAGKYGYDKAFNATYGVHDSSSEFTTNDIAMVEGENPKDGAAYGYIDYVFYLKATSDAANQSLNMTECNLLYDGAAITPGASNIAGVDIDRAWRVGVFSEKLSAGGGEGRTATVGSTTVGQLDPTATSSNQKAILGLAGSRYFIDGQAQASAAALGNVTNFKNGAENTAGVVLDTLTASGTTAYYKVLVRIWLDGEDDTCNSATYAALQSKKWSLNCKFELGQGTAIKGLNTDTSKTADTTHSTESDTTVDVAAPTTN